MIFSYKLNAVPLEKLLELYGDGNPDAFTEFYKRTKKFIYNFVRSHLRDQSEADEVFQEIYFRVHKYIATYDSSKKAIVWLISISRNCVRDYLRARISSRESAMEKMEDLAEARDRTDSSTMLNSLISEICDELSKEEASLLLERILHEDSYEEISERHGISEDNTRQRLSRSLKKLKDRFRRT